MKPLRVALFVLAPALLTAGIVAATTFVLRARGGRETAALPPHEEAVSESLSATISDPEITAIVDAMAAEGGAVLVTEQTPVGTDGAFETETVLLLTPEDTV